jgi:hypothetical protein
MSMYIYPLLFLPVVIDEAGLYLTRGGDKVKVDQVTTKHSFGCIGVYEGSETKDGWHKSGRIFSGTETANDIVEKL